MRAPIDTSACSPDAVLALEAARQSWQGPESTLIVPAQDGRLRALAQRAGWTLYEQQALQSLWRAEHAPQWAYRWVGERERPAMQALFAAIFGHPMSDALWRWKYGDGRGVGLGLWSGTELVAHYGGTTREVLLRGQPVQACQVCDVMVSPRARGGIVRRGPLANITATFLEHQIGHGLPHAIGFGFPNDRHHGVAQRMGLYEAVDEVVRMEWPAADLELPWTVQQQPLDPSALQPGGGDWAALQGLWQRMRRHFDADAIGVRDAAWIAHRYGRHPSHGYAVWLLRRRFAGNPLALLVCRQHDGQFECMDVVAEPQHFALAILAARRQARHARVPVVQAWITASHQRLFEVAGQAAPVVGRLGIVVPANAHTPGIPPAHLRQRWFLMSGDTDFR